MNKIASPSVITATNLTLQEIELTGKILADVVESFLAALLIDKGLVFAKKFLEVCLFSTLKVTCLS